MKKMNRICSTWIALLTFLLLLLIAFKSKAETRIRWPEVVGLEPDLAQKTIQKDMPAAKFQVVKAGESVTMDFYPWRVRIFLDSAGKVAKVPVVG